MNKKWISLILAAVMVISCSGSFVYANDIEEEIIDDALYDEIYMEEIPSEENQSEELPIEDTNMSEEPSEDITEPEPEQIVAVFEKESNILTKLGILDMEVEDYSKVITRAEFIAIVARLCGYNYDALLASKHFKDVSDEHINGGAIAFAAERKLVMGNGTDFRPDDPITAEESAYVLMRALGHDNFAPYVNIDIVKAQREGIFDGVSINYNENLTFDTAAKVIYNAMNTEMIMINGVTVGTGGSALQLTKGETTLLNYYLHIYKTKDVLTDNGYTALSGESQFSFDKVKIGNSVYEINNNNVYDLLGHKVEAYYDENNLLLHIADITDENDIMYISAEDIISGNKNTINYSDKNGKTRTVNLASLANIIYNGKALKPGEYNEQLFEPKLGGLKLVKTSGKGFDLVVITSQFDCAVKAIHENNGNYMFTDMDNSNKNVSFDIEDIGTKVLISDKTGKTMVYSAIAVYDVLTVSKSIDGEYINIIVCSEKQKGNIKAIKTGTNASMVVDGVTYPLVYDIDMTEIKPGIFGWFHLDMYGNVAYFRSYAAYEERYGYLIGVSVDGTFSNTFSAKIFDESGLMLICSADKSIKVDGVTVKSTNFGSVAERFYLGSEFQPCMVRFKLNLDGKLVSLDTYQEVESDTSLRKIEAPKEMDAPEANLFVGYRRYYINANRFDGDLFIDSDTKIFAIPDGIHGDEDYRLLAMSHFQANKYYDIEMYTTHDGSYMAEAMIVRYAAKYDPSNTNSNGYVRMPSYYANMMFSGVITGYEKCLDSNGDIKTLVTLFRLDNAKSYTFYLRWDDMSDSFDVGNVIRFCYMDDQIIDAELAFDCNTLTMGTPRVVNASKNVDTFVIRNNGREAADNATTAENTKVVQVSWVAAYFDVLSIKDGILTGAVCDASNSVDESNIRRLNLSKMASGVKRYNSRTGTLTTASADDLICYDETQSECSKILVILGGGTPRCAIILE